MKERRIMSMEDIEKKEKQLNTTLSDDEMYMASSGISASTILNR